MREPRNGKIVCYNLMWNWKKGGIRTKHRLNTVEIFSKSLKIHFKRISKLKYFKKYLEDTLSLKNQRISRAILIAKLANNKLSKSERENFEQEKQKYDKKIKEKLKELRGKI